MLPLLSVFTFAQATPTPTPTPPQQEIVQPQQVRPLPGSLDSVPVFNSNSPEVVQTEGILLSTFPPSGKKATNAHLDFPFQGRFDIFAHHIANATSSPKNLRTLYLGVLLHNPSTQPVTVDVLQAASYLSQPDAPFIDLPPQAENPLGTIFAGPGDRVMNDILRGRRQSIFPAQVTIPPQQSQMLLNLPIPVQTLEPPINGRSTLMRLRSSGRVYAASLAMYAKSNSNGSERVPTLAEWQQLLETGNLAEPRDRAPTPPEAGGKVIYGRVAGVAQGSQWQAQLVDTPSVQYLSIPQQGQAFSYGLSTLIAGRQGTNQVQSAPLLVRYPDTAYQAHGNYGIEYNLSLPLYNNTNQPQTISVSLQTPLKEDELTQGGLRFLTPPATQNFFRGTVRLRYSDDRGLPQTRYIHLVQKRGQAGEPLVLLNMPPGDRRLVQFDFLYPPDATPPQVLTIQNVKQ